MTYQDWTKYGLLERIIKLPHRMTKIIFFYDIRPKYAECKDYITLPIQMIVFTWIQSFSY